MWHLAIDLLLVGHMNKIYSVTVEVRLTIKANNRGDALLFARDAVARLDEIDTLKVTQVFCPAEGK